MVSCGSLYINVFAVTLTLGTSTEGIPSTRRRLQHTLVTLKVLVGIFQYQHQHVLNSDPDSGIRFIDARCGANVSQYGELLDIGFSIKQSYSYTETMLAISGQTLQIHWADK